MTFDWVVRSYDFFKPSVEKQEKQDCASVLQIDLHKLCRAVWVCLESWTDMYVRGYEIDPNLILVTQSNTQTCL